MTRLITADNITLPMRSQVARRGEHDLLWRLIRCPWCIGMWVSLAAVALAWWVAPHPVIPSWWMIPAEALACSYVVGWLATYEADD